MDASTGHGVDSRAAISEGGAAAFLLFLILGGVSGFFGLGAGAAAPAVQPIAFNHRLHVEEQGLACVDCHTGVLTEIQSGLPGAQDCELCHSEPQGESAEERKLVALLEAGTPLAWARLFRQPPHVFFSHRRHVVVAGLECTVCHGDIGASERPPLAPAPLAMEQCTRCHEQEGVPMSCAGCHR